MAQFGIVCFFGFLSTFFTACYSGKDKETEILFSEVGFHQQDSIMNFSFDVMNAGNSNLNIASISADCTCIALEIDIKKVLPNKKAVINGQINLNRYDYKDYVTSSVMIRSNSRNILDVKNIVMVLDADSVYRVI